MNTEELPTVVRRHTPPPLRTPAEELDPRTDYIPSTAPEEIADFVERRVPAVHYDDHYAISNLRRKPVSGEGIQTWVETGGIGQVPPAPTPGVDDSPYIQFAIDQLTRDEEIAGRSRSGTANVGAPLAATRGPSGGQVRPTERGNQPQQFQQQGRTTTTVTTTTMGRGGLDFRGRPSGEHGRLTQMEGAAGYSQLPPPQRRDFQDQMQQPRNDQRRVQPQQPPPAVLSVPRSRDGNRPIRNEAALIGAVIPVIGADGPRVLRSDHGNPPMLEPIGGHSHSRDNIVPPQPVLVPQQRVRMPPEPVQALPVVPVRVATAPGPIPIAPPAMDENANDDEHLVSRSDLPQDGQYPKLNYVPVPLRLPSMLALILLCLIVMIVYIIASIWSSTRVGLNRYDGQATRLYFVYQFLPQLVAAIILLWLRVVESAIQRILPFVLMASPTHRHLNVMEHTPLFLTNWLLPNLSHFQDKEPLLGVASIIFWLALWTIPLASCTFQALFTNIGWVWTAVQPVLWVLIILYFLLIVALALVWVRFLRPTGLKWDPVSLADIFVLLRRSNSVAHPSGYAHDGQQGSEGTSLGYWQSNTRPERISYGLGEDSSGPNTPAYEKRRSEQAPVRDSYNPDVESRRPLQASAFESWQSHDSGAMRHAWIPWFLRDSMIILWLVIALCLMIAYVVVSFVKNAVFGGFNATVNPGPGNYNFSSANFLYSFLPAGLGMIMYLIWLPVDTYFRVLQPYADLSAADGAEPTKSLLLGYNAELPFVCTVRAAMNGHIKVAWFSFMSIFSIFIPVLAGGVFMAYYLTGSDDIIRVIAVRPGYIALVIFVCIYALSWCFIWPQKKRYLPHDTRTVGDIRDFVAGGEMLLRPEWREPRTKADLVTRLISGGRMTGEKGSGRYRFGTFVSRDGRSERTGFMAV